MHTMTLLEAYETYHEKNPSLHPSFIIGHVTRVYNLLPTPNEIEKVFKMKIKKHEDRHDHTTAQLDKMLKDLIKNYAKRI